MNQLNAAMLEQEIHQVLTKYWGYPVFRPMQKEIILSVLQGNDTLGLLPTGGGKSICFQVPAMLKEGVCIVVSPLIALMKDQVENLHKKNIPAVFIVSGMSRNEIDIALDNCVFGKEKFLYVSPERLSSDIVQERIKRMKVNLLAIDEAHCISQWGYDFRPAYKKIISIREHLPDVPVLALTATATKVVENDIQKSLNFPKQNVFRKSFERKNLSYVVLYEEDKLNKILRIAQKLNGTGLVYARTRKKTRFISDFLNRNKIRSEYYHAGLSSQLRNNIQLNWMKEQTRIVVATNAFGMGIDKPNVRFVIHADAPESLEAYYQEAGRAGRDEEKSFAILLFNSTDRTEIELRYETGFPEIKTIKNVYKALCNYLKIPVGSGKGISFDFELSDFCSTYNLDVQTTYNCLKIIELQGLIAMNDAVGIPSRFHMIYKSEDLYEFQVKNPAYDHFIKVILRSYEGVFDDYVNIREEDIAKRYQTSKEEVIRILDILNRLKILSYLPENEKPQLTLLEERIDARDINIEREFLADRKKRYQERARALLHYAESKHRCRSQMLVAYFGEVNTHRCGICDYCLERNKADVSDLEFEKIQTDVKVLLRTKSLALEELVLKINPDEENKTMRVLEWMLDNELIAYNDDNRLRWNSQ